jgi:ELWxxDGT repeat protein
VDSLVAHTHVVKDIDAGAGDGIDLNSFSYLYTTTHLFFAANDGTNGNELWKTDGTEGGTEMVEDINPNAEDANPNFMLVLNGKVIFNATDGDDPADEIFDLYVVDGTFAPLPVTLTDFTVSLNEGDALLQWKTAQEINTKDFTVQRSSNGRDFENIGIVRAAGTVYNRQTYSFKDMGIINSGKEVAYYRLIVSDRDGKTKNTNVISLKLRGPGKWNVIVLSNPVRDNLRILLSGITSRVKVSIMDVSGKTIYTNSLQNVNGEISLPAKLQRGMHVLTVETNNERKVIQFVKQ